MLKVGQISYVNVAPFFYFWRDSSIDFIKGPPRYLGQLARNGQIDLAPLPVFDGFLLEETFEPLGNFGIAATGPVMSVFLFSKKRIEQLDHAVVLLTAESSTSVSLVALLLKEKYRLSDIRFVTDSHNLMQNRNNTDSFYVGQSNTGVQGFAPVEKFNKLFKASRQDNVVRPSSDIDISGIRNSRSDEPDAVLLIGDKALEEAENSVKWPYKYDLAELWHNWTSLPFTFARWVVRKSLADGDKKRLSRMLSENLEHAFSNLEEISAGESARTGMRKETISTYLRNFTFRLGSPEEEGIALFKSKLSKCGLLQDIQNDR
ncbi:MAG: menaquinone biosynthesis protein [Candidatus Riflebacteria bacterium]|nr:menaquinone biosynthesis protein [Candidatus Riflebacteria bacterium]